MSYQSYQGQRPVGLDQYYQWASQQRQQSFFPQVGNYNPNNAQQPANSYELNTSVPQPNNSLQAKILEARRQNILMKQKLAQNMINYAPPTNYELQQQQLSAQQIYPQQVFQQPFNAPQPIFPQQQQQQQFPFQQPNYPYQIQQPLQPTANNRVNNNNQVEPQQLPRLISTPPPQTAASMMSSSTSRASLHTNTEDEHAIPLINNNPKSNSSSSSSSKNNKNHLNRIQERHNNNLPTTNRKKLKSLTEEMHSIVLTNNTTIDDDKQRYESEALLQHTQQKFKDHHKKEREKVIKTLEKHFQQQQENLQENQLAAKVILPLWRYRLLYGNNASLPSQATSNIRIMRCKALFKCIVYALRSLIIGPQLAILQQKKFVCEKKKKEFARSLRIYMEGIEDWLTKSIQLPITSIVEDHSLDFQVFNKETS
jgi:hypothetical protein